MREYNAAFFGLFENTFITLVNHYGKQVALNIFQEIMEIGLEKAYGNNFVKGKVGEFVRIVGERDKSVGLHVEFPEVTDKKIVYQFYDDPFPCLRNHVDFQELDATYLNFKIKILLGSGWHYKTTKHLWLGDAYTEHVITR